MALFRKDSRALDALFADAEGIDPTKMYGPLCSYSAPGYRCALSAAPAKKTLLTQRRSCAQSGEADDRSYAQVFDRWIKALEASLFRAERWYVLPQRLHLSDGRRRVGFAGFLLYYEPRDKPLVFFDFHPKGVLPLDSADIQAVDLTDGPKVDGQRTAFGIDITHSSFGGRALSLAVETEAMRNTWVAAMEASRHVTYKNAVTGSTSVDMYKDMATHSQERMSKLSSQLIAAKKEIKALKEANAAKNEHLVSVLTAVASASASHGIKIPLPSSPAPSPSDDSGDEHAGTQEGAAISTPEQTASGAGPTLADRRGVRFESGGGSDADEGAELSLSITDTEDVQTAGSMKPQHGGSPGRTPAPRQAMEQLGFTPDDDEEDEEGGGEGGQEAPTEKKALSFEGDEGGAADTTGADSAATPPAQEEQAPPAQAPAATNPFA